MVVVGIHQSHYLPWLRYFEKIARSDVFILLDDIQYSINGWQNRNKVKTSNGPHVLTVPVHASLGCAINQVHIDNQIPWRKKHLQTIRQSYTKAPFFSIYVSFLEEIYDQEWESLAALNHTMLIRFLQFLGITTPVIPSSELHVPGTATERLAGLVKAVGGDVYYSGAYACETYLDADILERHGVALKLQYWHAPHYPQLHGTFVPDLSIIDLLMHCGPDSLNVILDT